MEKEKKVLKCIDNKGLENRLTIGRYYPVEYTYVDDSFKLTGYHILDDYGCYSTYSTKYFVEGAPRSLSTTDRITDPIVEQVKDFFDKRSQVGIKKYGTTLYENNKDNFLDHLREELHDAILYLTKLQNDMIKSESEVYSKQELSTNQEKKESFVETIGSMMEYGSFSGKYDSSVKYLLDSIENGDLNSDFDFVLIKEKAKELFEQQIIYAFTCGKYSSNEYKSGRDFFNKNFK